MATDISPNGTVQEQWTSSGSPNHAEIDEARGAASITDYIKATGSAEDNVIDIYSFPDTINDVDEITQIAVSIFYTAFPADESPSGTFATIDIDLGGYLGSKTLAVNEGTAWTTLTWAGLAGSQADLNDFELKVAVGTLNDGKYVADYYVIGCIVVEITYTAVAVGYGHDYMGVPAANIGSVNGVPTANIASIKGV